MASAYNRVAGWPEDSILLRSGKTRISQILANIILLLFVLLFFIYAGLVRHSDGTMSNAALVRQLDQVSHYGPTIFPILFSLVVGGSLRSLALYRLQAGEKVGLLDLLFGSTTIGNTIVTLLERNFIYFDIISVGLLILWALSPLGGQATLRVIGYHGVAITRPVGLTFLDYSRSIFPYALEASDLGPLPIPLSSAFVSSLSSPSAIQMSASDLWGNVKTPVLESLPEYGTASEGDWVPVPTNSNETWYASLIGVPVANIPHTGHTRFQMELSYWDMECSGFGNATEQDSKYRIDTLNRTKKTGCSDNKLRCSIIDESLDLQGSTNSWGWIVSTNNSVESVNQRCHSNSTSNPPRRQLMYSSWNSDASETVAKCTIGTSFVEVSVGCKGWNCGVDRMRKSLQHPSAYSAAATSLDKCPRWEDDFPSTAKFMNLMISAIDSQVLRAATPGLLQYYLQHPNKTQGVYEDIHLTEVGNDNFTKRFSVLLNTYWSAIYNYNLSSQGHPDALIVDYDYYSYDPISNATGTNTVSEQRFVFNRAWYAVLVISTSILFSAAFSKLILDLHILIPNLQLNASTLLRGNVTNCPNLPSGGSAMDDCVRSRLLRHQKVRFGHCIINAGHVDELGIGELEEDEGFIKRVKRGEKYY
ncbi:hypothetical protein F5Y03DRAFT_404049 [Xylaria venustula]|nr:hypothetical protein F5Y03DRAFT_404049 [Xylaria venustula]